MQPGTNPIVCAGHRVRLQLLSAGELYRLARIVVCIPPGEEPASGRQSHRRDAYHPLRIGDGKKKPALSPRGGGARQCRE